MNEPKHQAAFRERQLCARLVGWICSNICLGCQALIFCPSSRDLTMWDLTWKRNKISSWAISSLHCTVSPSSKSILPTKIFKIILRQLTSKLNISLASLSPTVLGFGVQVHQSAGASVRRTCHKLWLFGASIISPWHHDIFDLQNNARIWYTLRLGFHQQLSSASAASSVENRRGESRYINTSLLRSSRGDIFISCGESRYINTSLS